MINYDHSKNLHTKKAPKSIVPVILAKYKPKSVLDVGCGTGVWLDVFSESGLEDLFGIDGKGISAREYNSNPSLFKCIDLTKSWSLGRKFDLAISLEVAEHIPEKSSHALLNSICKHADKVVFSAACPRQFGQGHVNCQWPEYWQLLFNQRGFTCEDSIRKIIWDFDFPEYWYKQNIFYAERNPVKAGKEPRISSLVHPHMLEEWARRWESQDTLLSGSSSLRRTIKMALQMTQKALLNRLGASLD